jgi:drug/metabolite transporter (DMT)-like permease
MTGVLWAAAAGVGFGLFQSVNRAALREMAVYQSTFVQVAISAVILLAASAATDDLARIGHAPARALANFAAAGVIHFTVGWTLLNASQKRIGATRTGPLIATTPLFAMAVAALTLDEVPGVTALLGVATIMVGVYVVTLDPGRLRHPVSARPATVASATRGASTGAPFVDRTGAWAGSLFGLGTALCWAISPVFIRHGLEDLASPLLGVTVGLLAAVAVYAAALLATRRPVLAGAFSRAALPWKLTAAVLVGLSTWIRWYAFSLSPVAVVLGLGLLSVPTVILLAPLLVGRQLERVTARVVAGSGLVLLGAAVLIVQS